MIMVCTLCELCEKTAPISGHFFTTTNKNVCDVMIVGDFPKEEDLKNRRVFSGAIGTELAKLINQAKIDINNVYVTTLIKGRPVAPNGLDGRMRVSHVNACQINLIEEIATVNPKIIVLFGDAVFKYFYPKESFTDNRGKVLTNNAFKIPTIATYHPMAMLGSAKFDQLIRADFATAGNFLKPEAVETHTTKKDYRFVVGSLDFLEKVAKRVKEIPTFAFDIETHGTGLFNYKLLSVGLSWKEHTGVSIPVYVKDESICTEIQRVIDYVPPERQEKTQVTLKNGTVKEKIKKIKGWTEEDTRIIKDLLPSPYKHLADKYTHTALKAKLKAILDQEPPLKRYWGDQHERCMALIKEIMECDTSKGAHNGSYDVNRLRGKGIIVKNYAWDTILMHHMIDEERPHGLDDLSFVYTKDGGYKSEKNKYLKSGKTSWANIPMDVLLPYNAQDADVTLQLYHKFKEIIYKEPKRVKLFEKLIMPAQHMLCDMSFRGTPIDMDWVKKTKADYIKKMNGLKVEFSQLVSQVVPNVYVVDSPEEQAEMEKRIKEQAAEAGVEPKLPNFLNMNSVQQLIVLFRDYYKIPLTKKTKSGDALDAAVLKKLGKKYKAAEILLEYKKLKKLESTYLSPNIDSDGNLHGEFLLYGTESGRLSCLAGDTPVYVVDKRREVPIKDVKQGDFVLGFDSNRKPVARKVLWSGKTKHSKVVRVTYKNNTLTKSIVCTEDHRFRVRDGSYVEAKDLQYGDRLLAIERGKNLSEGYPRLFITGYKDAVREHRVVAGLVDKDARHVHHIDGNKENNLPSNLCITTNSEHIHMHTPSKESVKKGLATRKNRIDAGIIKFKRKAESPIYRDIPKEALEQALFESQGKATKACLLFKTDWKTFNTHAKDTGVDVSGISSMFTKKEVLITEELLEQARNLNNYTQAAKLLGVDRTTVKKLLKKDHNHYVVSVEKLPDAIDVYDITVEDIHNFIANGVCVHNCRRPNLQNQPPDVKPMYVPPPGYLCVNVDQSAAELHVMAYMSGDQTMIKAFEDKVDLHKFTACSIFNKEPEDITHDERQIAKKLNFMIAYAVSPMGLADQLTNSGIKISDTQAKKYMDKWKARYHRCAKYLEDTTRNYSRYGKLETPFGRIRHKYKKYSSAERESASERTAQNFTIQSTASDIQLYEMVQMYPTLIANGVLPVFTVHDSIVMWCPKDKLLWLRDYYKKMTCRRFPNEEFPGLNNCLMYTEMEVGRNYGEHIKLPYDCDFEKWKTENSFLFEQLGGGTNG